jgi:hypothetical protein
MERKPNKPSFAEVIEQEGLSGVAYDWADEVDAIEGSSNTVNRLDFAGNLRHAERSGAGADQNRRSLFHLGGKSKSELNASAGINCHARMKVDASSRYISKLSHVKLGGMLAG